MADHYDSAIQDSPTTSPHPSRRPSMVAPRPSYPASTGGASLSRRSSQHRSGPIPISRADYSGPTTPSLSSRAGSPTLPLTNDKVLSRKSSFAGDAHGARAALGGGLGGSGGSSGFSALSQLDGQRQSRKGEFIGSLDCGTTSTRFIVFDENAKIITEHQTEFEQVSPYAGWHEQRPEDLVDAMRECINRACYKLEWAGWSADSIRGIGITNQRETTVCWSKSTGKPSCDAIVWDDTRTVAVVREFEEKSEKEGIELEEANGDGKPKRVTGRQGLVDITGIPSSTYFSAIKSRWMLDHYKEVAEANSAGDLAFGTVDSWLVYNSTGALDGGSHIIDVTNASRTSLMSSKTLKWSKPSLKFFGIDESVLPEIVPSAAVYGKIHESMETPSTGVPIAGIVGDQQAALVGNKCSQRGEAKNTYGTGAFVSFNTGDEIVHSKNGLITTVAYQTGKDAQPVYALEGSIAVAGSAIKWLRDQMTSIEESAEMDMLAGSVKDTGGVYFVTAFAGLLAPYWDRSATGTIIGMTSYTTSAHIARATLEAVCFQSRAVLDVIEKEANIKLEGLKVDGGVTNSDSAMQIQANIGGFNVIRPAMRESTALGSASLAGHALGSFGWDSNKPETSSEVNTADTFVFKPEISDKQRAKMIRGWDRAVARARNWHEGEDELELEERELQIEKKEGIVDLTMDSGKATSQSSPPSPKILSDPGPVPKPTAAQA